MIPILFCTKDIVTFNISVLYHTHPVPARGNQAGLR